MVLLVIRCAACKNKLWKYDKIGKGEVLRCYKDRIVEFYSEEFLRKWALIRKATSLGLKGLVI